MLCLVLGCLASRTQAQTTVFNQNFDGGYTGSYGTSHYQGGSPTGTSATVLSTGGNPNGCLQITMTATTGSDYFTGQAQLMTVSGNTDPLAADYVFSFDAKGSQAANIQLGLESWQSNYFSGAKLFGVTTNQQLTASNKWQTFRFNLGSVLTASPTGATWQLNFQINASQWGGAGLTNTLTVDNIALTRLGNNVVVTSSANPAAYGAGVTFTASVLTNGVVAGNAHVFAALASQQSKLADLVTVFNATMGALAARQHDLSATIALLPPLLHSQNSALGPLQASFGPTRAFARELTPSVKQLDPTIGAGLPWIAQATALLSPRYLGGLLSSLTPAVDSTSGALNSTKALLSGSDELARCLVHNVIPTGNQEIQDPPLTTGLQVYQELFQSAVGLAGAAENFDGNGRYVRSSAGGGSDRVATGPLPGGGPLYGNAVLPPLGTRPAFPGKAPPLRRDIPCFRNAEPNLNDARTGAGP